MTTITHAGGNAITPLLTELASLDAETTSRTITHEILDGDPVHTLRPARPRTGTLQLVFATGIEADAARDELGSPDVFTIDGPDPRLRFRFVVRTARVTNDPAGFSRLAVEFEAVAT